MKDACLRKKCLWSERIIVYRLNMEKAYNPSCNDNAKIVSMDRSWVYCPWCGKKIEVKK